MSHAQVTEILARLQGEHWAGQDLTAELPDAPHTDEVFARMKAIGKLE